MSVPAVGVLAILASVVFGFPAALAAYGALASFLVPPELCFPLACLALPIPGSCLGVALLLRAQLRARWTLYAITDRRVILLSVGPTREVVCLDPESLRDVRYRRRGDGSGDVRLIGLRRADGQHRPSWTRMVGVEDVDHVKRLLDVLAARGPAAAP